LTHELLKPSRRPLGCWSDANQTLSSLTYRSNKTMDWS
jgi:hypothetical protein